MTLNAQQCVAQGQCIVMSNEIWYTTIGIYIFAALVLISLFFCLSWSPAMTFIIAKLKKQSVLAVVNRSQNLKFLTGKISSEGVIEHKSAPYLITENSHVREHKSGLPLFFAFGEFAATLPLKWVYVNNKIIDQESELKNQITNVEEMGAIVGKRFDSKTNKWMNQPGKFHKFKDFGQPNTGVVGRKI